MAERHTSSWAGRQAKTAHIHSWLMPSYHEVAESEHELQNPTSPGKIRLLGAGMRLDSVGVG